MSFSICGLTLPLACTMHSPGGGEWVSVVSLSPAFSWHCSTSSVLQSWRCPDLQSKGGKKRTSNYNWPSHALGLEPKVQHWEVREIYSLSFPEVGLANSFSRVRQTWDNYSNSETSAFVFVFSFSFLRSARKKEPRLPLDTLQVFTLKTYDLFRLCQLLKYPEKLCLFLS